jgi:hypothetical protein
MHRILTLVCAMLLLAPAMMAQTKAKPSDQPAQSKAQPLDDAALDGVTAGGSGDDGGSSGGSGGIQISGNALQGEQSLVQINANNSTVTVLVNLTVITNSTVGTVSQGNNTK